MNDKLKIRFSGRGGQGIKFLGSALVRVAMTANYYATLTVDYTPSVRGGPIYCDVIIDFSKVEIINSSNISNLLILRGLLQDKGRRLIICCMSTVTRCIFVVAGLADIFVFIDDKYVALEAVKNSD